MKDDEPKVYEWLDFNAKLTLELFGAISDSRIKPEDRVVKREGNVLTVDFTWND